MSENNCAVYVHVNLINGKKYFGITTQEPEKRWANGNGYIYNAHFTNAIKKYGWGNFAHYVLYSNIPVKIAKNIEEMLIREHMTHDPQYGYNKTFGGELERPSEEARKKISENHADVSGEKHPMFGKHHSDETRKAQREAKRYKMRPVVAIDPETGERVFCFESTMDAERAGFGFDHGHIGKCCMGKYRYKTHKGYVWRYAEEVNDDGSDNRR